MGAGAAYGLISCNSEAFPSFAPTTLHRESYGMILNRVVSFLAWKTRWILIKKCFYFSPREKNSAFIFSVFSAFLTSLPGCCGEQTFRRAEPSAQPREIPPGGQAVPTALFPDQDTAPSTAAEKNWTTSSVTSQAQAKGCKCSASISLLSGAVGVSWVGSAHSSGCLCWSWAPALAAQCM